MLIVYPIPVDFYHQPAMRWYPIPFAFPGEVFKIADDEQRIAKLIQDTAPGAYCHVVLDYQDFCDRTLGNNQAVDALRRLRSHSVAGNVRLMVGMQSSAIQARPVANRCLVEQADEVYEYFQHRGTYIATKTRGDRRPVIENDEHIFDHVVKTQTLPKLYMFQVSDYTTALVGYRNEDGFYVQRGDGTCYHYDFYRIVFWVELDVSADFSQIQGRDALLKGN